MPCLLRPALRSLAMGCLVLLSCAACAGADDQLRKVFESFEEGVSESWQSSADRVTALQLNRRFVKDGTQSLEWNWTPGEVVTVETAIAPYAEMRIPWFYPAFQMWMYQARPHDGELAVSFLRDDEVLGQFAIDLGFRGWVPIAMPYEQFEALRASTPPQVNRICFQAPPSETGGQVIVDAIYFDGWNNSAVQLSTATKHDTIRHSDARRKADSEITSAQRPLTQDEQRELATLADKAFSAVRDVFPVGNDASANTSNCERVMGRYRALGLVRDEYGIYSTTGQHIADGLPDWRLMLTIARMYHRFPVGAEERDELASAYCDLFDFMIDEGGVWKPSWYGGYPLALATFLMKDVLAQHGLLSQAAEYVRWGYDFDTMFEASSPEQLSARVNMDHFGMDVPVGLLMTIIEPDDWKRHAYLKRYAENLSAEILAENGDWGGFKPDGSAYHHSAHYYAYLRYCGAALSEVVKILDDTEYAIAQEAFDRLKTVYLNLRFYSNGEPSPNLGGRHPFRSRFDDLASDSSAYLNLAWSNPSLAPAQPDPELAAAYLLITGQADGSQSFDNPALLPEPPPVGHLSMPLASLAAHRRDTWLALARCPSRYLWTSELFANREGTEENRRGRYQGAGTLDVFPGTDLEESGYRHEGWDYAHFPGATAMDLTEDELLVREREPPWVLTDQTCVGGLSHRGWNGCFAADFDEPLFTNGVSARKSYFFFDDCIVALGTDISSADPEHEVHTTLFQIASPTQTSFNVQGQCIDAFPTSGSRTERATSMLLRDSRGTGYYIFPDQKLTWRRALQRNFRTPEDSSGTPFSTAWITHGKGPRGASYRYIVLPKSTEHSLAAFRDQMEGKAQAPVEIVMQESAAHLVYYAPRRCWAGVLFRGTNLPPHVADSSISGATLMVKRSNIPCLFMTESDETGNRIVMTVADPDLRIEKHGEAKHGKTVSYGTSRLTLTLAGHWTLSGETPYATQETADSDTVIHVQCRQGQSYSLCLESSMGD